MSNSAAHTQHIITPSRTYWLVWATLIVLTFATVYVARINFAESFGHQWEFLSTLVALGVAVTKASLVVLIFMGVRYNTPLTKVVVVSGFVWLVIMFGLTMGDYMSRAWLGVPGR
jgi:cytochrome c oxidase subunit IV